MTRVPGPVWMCVHADPRQGVVRIYTVTMVTSLDAVQLEELQRVLERARNVVETGVGAV